jgi:hypothetical protein
MADVGAPIQTWMASLSPSDRDRVITEIHAVLHRYYDGEIVRMPANVNIACGRKGS